MFESFLGQWNCFLMSRSSLIRKKTSQSHREDSNFLQKLSISFIGPNEMKLYNAEKCQETIWAVIYCSLRFLILHRTRKEGRNSSFSNNCVFNSITGNTSKTGQNCFFQPEDGFSRKIFLWLHMLWRNVLLTCTINFSKPWGPFAIAI